MAMTRPVITLTTDFGLIDTYVAQMKGVILGINPSATVVDVTHGIPPQSILRGAMVVGEIVEAFPADTIHVVVVDPGVGGPRRIVAVEMAGQRFVAPDNGVLSLAASRHPMTRVVELTREDFWRTPTSRTFHGRDIMAPVAARWSLGHDVSDFGEIRAPRLASLPEKPPRQEGRETTGTVRWVDAFGNLITNLGREHLPDASWSDLIVETEGTRIAGIHHYYGEAAQGDLLALVGSSGLLEIAVANGSASERLGLGVGAPVRVAIADDATATNETMPPD